jgi:tyrosine-protein phosphatase YwqE
MNRLNFNKKQERYTRRKKYAKMLLDAGIVHFVSSDAHNTDVRPPQNRGPSRKYVIFMDAKLRRN